MPKTILSSAVLTLAVGLLACQPPGTAADLKEIKEQQARILEKLTALEKGQEKLQGAARAPTPAARAQEDFDRVYSIDVANAPVRGKNDARVTIVEYSDFQCPFCARAQPMIEALLDKYPDDVRLVYKHFPLSFHKAAKPTAIASVAAHEQGKFWELHDVLFESSASLDPSKIEQYAQQAGLDMERFRRDLAERRSDYEKLVNADYAAGTRIDVRGTPTLYINGKKVRNRTVEGMSAMVEAALAANKGG